MKIFIPTFIKGKQISAQRRIQRKSAQFCLQSPHSETITFPKYWSMEKTQQYAPDNNFIETTTFLEALKSYKETVFQLI